VKVTPRRFSSARLALFRVIEHTCVLLGGRAFYRRCHLAPGRFRVREERVEVAGLDAALDGFAIAHLSDLHAGPFLGRGDLAHVVETVNREGVDLVALTGDYCVHHHEEALRILPDLARLEARHGVFAVFGNHDYKGRQEGKIAAEYGAHGIRFLRNASARIEVEGGALAVVGVEDLEEGRLVDLQRARADLEGGDWEVALCHNPRGGPWLARGRCAVVLAGHSHGGQVDLPLLRGLGPPHPGLRVELGPTTLVVNRGLGALGVPLRVGAPAEVVVVRLAVSNERAAGETGTSCTAASP